MYLRAILSSQSVGHSVNVASLITRSKKKNHAAVNQFGLIVPAAHVCPPLALHDHGAIKVRYKLSNETLVVVPVPAQVLNR
jgi:hypothetical protein